MRTRNTETPKSTTTPRKTPPARKAAAKTPPATTEPAPESSVTPKSAETKRASATRAKQVKVNEPITPSPSTESKPEPAVDAVQPERKAASGTKTTRKVVKRIVVRKKTPASAGAASKQASKSGESGQVNVEESTNKKEEESTKDAESTKKEELLLLNVEESAKKEEHAVENVEGSTREDLNVANFEEPAEKEEAASELPQPSHGNLGKSLEQEDAVAMDVVKSSYVVKSSENQEPSLGKGEVTEEVEEETNIVEDNMEPNDESIEMEEDAKNKLKGEDAQLEEDLHGTEKMEDVHIGETMEEYSDEEVHEESGVQEFAEDDVLEHGEERETLDEEHAQLNAAAKERKIKKELEIFVGGLDRDAVEEDVKKVFENVGVVVDVRLHKDPSSNKNKGYAFVKFATKEQASRALTEMKNPVICGKRCGTAPSEDNDTLFLGNICNTWTKEAIKQKLKDYGIEGVENITLVADAQHEGLSRGFAFLEFPCHADAMLAYKRLQKPDVVFGHHERTAKVAFAEPLREPDPEVMAQVKSVFVDGLPPHWDEDRVREKFKDYGEIERIMLARNMSTAKRKDFGFVDFTTHEAAVACIDEINNLEFGDGNLKTKVKARLSNPLPKIQAVKGGMCGGFRIGHGSSGNFPKFGRGFGRGGQPFNRPNFQRGRGFYQRGRSQAGRMGFANEPDHDSPYPPFHGRQNFGRGRWGPFRGAHQPSGGGALPARTNLDRHRHVATDRGHGDPVSFRRQPFRPEEGFNRPYGGRHFDEPYFYDDAAHGMKRPYFMTDQDPDYTEPSRLRPRFDYSDQSVAFRGTRSRETFGAGPSVYSQDYYGSDHGGGPYSSFYGGDRPYGGGYYY
ncbi:unnamed protein product [Ilex paraguariensis]|uniref:RRM domain-containing protein n=1 Tax=Ilex paraguariensis TaxID=185542 RepID=A0ABC8SIM5_9AQUA